MCVIAAPLTYEGGEIVLNDSHVFLYVSELSLPHINNSGVNNEQEKNY